MSTSPVPGGMIPGDYSNAPADKNTKQTTAFERHYPLKPDAVVDITGDMPVNDPADSTHKHVIVQWEGGEIWLDMSVQRDHFCVDVRQFNPDDEMKGQGVMTIVNGYQRTFSDETLLDTDGTPVTGHGWNGGYVITLMTDKHGQEAAAKLPSNGNG